MGACPKCGHRNPDVARYCQNCATLLGGAPETEGVRKTVTVLFSDVVSSSQLVEHLDPEAVRTVMARFFEALRAPIERHGGTVEKYIGDAVMAVFGVPVVHEDDALRACRAAVEMRDGLARLNEELERELGVTIAMRIGISSGEVVAGDRQHAQTLVTGEPVVAAARLEQGAKSGDVLVGEPTFRLVGDVVAVEPIDRIRVKGRVDPLPAFRLLSVAPDTGPSRPRLASPLVGRLQELDVLQKTFERALTDRRCILTTVIGQPGVGKSRLVHEFLALLGDRAKILRGRCLPYGDGITFWPLAEVVRQATGIAEGMSLDEALSRVEAMLPKTDARQGIRDRVAAAIGLSESAGGIQETFWAIRRFLEALATEDPVVVVFEDIHWAEPTFLDLVEYLEGRVETSLLLVCLARPELLNARADWAKEATGSATMQIEPLDPEETSLLIENLLDASPFPDEINRAVGDKAEGNPLFIEEMLSMLIDDERLTRRNGGWATKQDLVASPIPPSVQGVLAARIERLPADQRAVIQRASVVGRVFWWGAVADLSPPEEQGQIGSILQTLIRNGLLVPDETAFGGEDAYKFRHILIRDAAYASLPRATRASLHERFADWMERVAGERAEEYEEIIGYHLEQACRERLRTKVRADPALAIRASRTLSSAGRRALGRDDIRAALNLLTRASELCPSDEPEALEIPLHRAEALRLAGRPTEANQLLAQLEKAAAAVGDRGAEWRAKIVRSRIFVGVTKVETDELGDIIEHAVRVFSELEDDWGLAKTWSFEAWLEHNAGHAAKAREAAEKAAAHAAAVGDAAGELWSLVSGGTYATFGPTPVEEALELCNVILARIRGHMGHEAAIHLDLALLQAMRGAFDTARDSISHARALFQELSVTHGLAGMTGAAGDVERLAGNAAAEERERRSGYEAFRAMDAAGYVPTWAAELAVCLVRLGRDDEALELTRESERVAASDDITAQVPWRLARAEVLARRGETEAAEEIVREAVAIAEGTDWLNLRADAQMTLGGVLRTLGRRDEAIDAFRAAAERYEEKGNVVAAGWAHGAMDA